MTPLRLAFAASFVVATIASTGCPTLRCVHDDNCLAGQTCVAGVCQAATPAGEGEGEGSIGEGEGSIGEGEGEGSIGEGEGEGSIGEGEGEGSIGEGEGEGEDR